MKVVSDWRNAVGRLSHYLCAFSKPTIPHVITRNFSLWNGNIIIQRVDSKFAFFWLVNLNLTPITYDSAWIVQNVLASPAWEIVSWLQLKCLIIVIKNVVNLHPNEYSQEFHYYPFWLIYLINYVFQIKQKI